MKQSATFLGLLCLTSLSLTSGFVATTVKGNQATTSVLRSSQGYSYDDSYTYQQMPGPNIAPPQPMMRVEEPDMPPPPPPPPPAPMVPRTRQALNIGPLLGLDKGYPWEAVVGPNHLATRTVYVEPGPIRVGQALNIGPLLGLDKGFPWTKILAQQPIGLRDNYVEQAPARPTQALNVGPLLGLDKGYPWYQTFASLPQALRNSYVEESPGRPKRAFDVGPLLGLDKGIKWKELVGPATRERMRMETFVQ